MMKRFNFVLLTTVAALGLSACSSESPEPAEQIVVREPGEVASVADDVDLAAEGRKAFAACVACHAVEQGEASGAGPNLFVVVGRQAGTLADFAYSDAMASAGFTWTEEELATFLTNPSEKVPETTMTAGTVGDADKRVAIAAYLASLAE